MSKVFCNPLNLDYKYQAKKILGTDNYALFREAADPTLVLFKDVYYLFPSMTGGFYYSTDLCNWKFHRSDELPKYDYAPDVRVQNDRIIFTASNRTKKPYFYECDDPLNKPFTKLKKGFFWWDPDTFVDDDGKIYFYWGCSSKTPIYGVEINPKNFRPIGKTKELIFGRDDIHGFEVKGENGIYIHPTDKMGLLIEKYVGTGPFIEGAFMVKHNNKYYLNYAGPGTEVNTYSNGVYVSDNPLGPFTYQLSNPFSSVFGGFITGAGHGSTIADKNNNYWHIATPRISINEKFERRLGLYPLYFDDEGIMFCDQYLPNYPMDVETRKRLDVNLLEGVMSASSFKENHEPFKANDENIRDWWVASSKSLDEYLLMDLKEVKEIKAIQVNFADENVKISGITEKDYHKAFTDTRYIYVDSQETKYILEGSIDGENYELIKKQEGSDTPHDFIYFEEAKHYRYLKISQIVLPFDGEIAISGLRVFGKGNGNKPSKVTDVKVETLNPIRVKVNFDKTNEAASYIISLGIAKDKLYQSIQIFNNEYEIPINANTKLFARVDAINENGITLGDVFELVK